MGRKVKKLIMVETRRPGLPVIRCLGYREENECRLTAHNIRLKNGEPLQAALLSRFLQSVFQLREIFDANSP